MAYIGTWWKLKFIRNDNMMSKEKLRVDIIVPLQQHSYRTAKGLISSGNLNRYYTSVYNNGKGIYKILDLLLPSGIKKRIRAKREQNLLPFVKCHSTFLGLFFLFILRIPSLISVYHYIREILVNRCGLQSAKDSCKRGTHIIWCFDTMALSAFKYAKSHGAICVLEMASTSVSTIREIVDTEYNKHLPFSYTLERHRRLYPVKKSMKLSKEIELADYVVVATTFVKECLIKEGCSPAKIRLIPLGMDSNKFNPKTNYLMGNKIRFLFVGRLESAKGIDYVLEVFKQLCNYNIELICVGEYFGEKSIYESYAPNVKLSGLKRPDEMPDIYKSADVYIQPSLWEGFSFSLLEAMASGLPVIATKFSCAPDIVEDYKQGFVIEPRDIENFKDKILWFVNNPNKIQSMGMEARVKAKNITWDNYYNGISELVEEINNI